MSETNTPNDDQPSTTRREVLRRSARWAMGGTLIFAGTGHLTFARRAFQAQVPPWIPIDPDTVVLASGAVEIGLGTTIALAPPSRRQLVGTGAALFFAAVFPGNISQYRQHRDAFGLDTDRKRALRLLGQPLLVAWAWWSTRTPATPASR